ncbi:alanyl-tRNA editing protein [Rhodobacteraceae bacterium R_SAG10]|nr:alanyl-tRNA editing protein [Rhodobacteraceae bacterium R_SAG10]
MSVMLFREDAYLRQTPAIVVGHTDEGGLILDRCLFYPTGGGQPGDSGRLDWDKGSVVVATTIKGTGDDIILVPGAPQAMPPVGQEVTQVLDWDRRQGHMRIHTALHLLSVAVPLPVNGGSIGANKGRLDFDMPDAVVDKGALDDALNNLIMRDLEIIESWISDEELLANPDLVKTMSVRPPTGQGRVRMIAIGQGAARIDYQPCGGTHVARTSEIGVVRIGKIQNKGRQNRRISIHLDG